MEFVLRCRFLIMSSSSANAVPSSQHGSFQSSSMDFVVDGANLDLPFFVTEEVSLKEIL